MGTNTLGNQTPKIEFCLYARKSSESDERQAMSIDSQIKEMTDLAKKDNLLIKNVYKESHSAKMSGSRPIFMQLLGDIRNGLFNGILTWAPDRLSRNAGDLGMLVDLMDQEKLLQIKTYSQVFSNNPNEKFLLMILCSQAKLENDQKGVNVKRGIRAKCEMGWRPGMAPLGYFNRAFAGTKDIIIDPERGPIVKKAFERVAYQNYSGRKLKRWLDKVGFSNRSGKPVTLSQVYLMLKNHFYYGKFEYPEGISNWYKGAHEPLITKELFDNVRKKLIVPKKSKWGSKILTFKGLFKCASCQAAITGEEKLRKLKSGGARKHIYYHCTKQVNYHCPEPYITEERLISQLVRFVNFMEVAHPQTIKLTDDVKKGMEKFRLLRDEILIQQDINPDKEQLKIKDYAKHILRNGSIKEKREIVAIFDQPLYLHNRNIYTKPL